MTAETLRCPTCGSVAPDGSAKFCPHDGAPLAGAAPWRDPLVGTTLDGRYRILVRVGEGGFAVVYHARHERIATDVAVKVLKAEHARDASVLARFATEARTTSLIDHDNVVRVMDFGCAIGDRPYFVTEYVPGTPLHLELAAVGALPPLRVAHVTAQIAAGVGRAHELGIVHRDLKPENVMLVRRGSDADVVKILDFGIARVASGARMTRAGDILGTPYYMAPELWQAQAIDARSDVYALGAMIFEMLTGRPPFEGSLTTVMIDHLQTPPPVPTSHVPSLRAGAVFDELVTRCMAKRPEDRYASMEALLGALSRAWSEVGRPSGRLTYANTAAAPPSRAGSIPDATAYQSAPIDVVWDGGTLCEEIRRLHLLRMRRLDELVHVLWPTGMPPDAHAARMAAEEIEERIEKVGEDAALSEARIDDLWRRSREGEARLRLEVIDANLARALAHDPAFVDALTDVDFRLPQPAGTTPDEGLRRADMALAAHHRKQRHDEGMLRDKLARSIGELGRLEREVAPIHEKLAAVVRKEASRRPELRPIVMAFAEVDGALAAHQGLLEGLETAS